MTRRVLAAALAAFCAFEAGAEEAPAPDAYAEARRAAAHHVQLRIRDVGDLPWHLDHGPCPVRGEVVRVFRGTIEEGAELTVAVDCAKPRAQLSGPALWTSWRALEQASYLEAYLDASGAVAKWQSVLLSEASDEPACPEDAEGSC